MERPLQRIQHTLANERWIVRASTHAGRPPGKVLPQPIHEAGDRAQDRGSLEVLCVFGGPD